MATTVKDGITTRKIAILAADGVDDAALSGMKKALTAAGAQAKVVAPRLGRVEGRKGRAKSKLISVFSPPGRSCSTPSIYRAESRALKY